MIRSASTLIRVGLLPGALLCLVAPTDVAAGRQAGANRPTSYSSVPMSQGDHFVPGKYDRSGTYVPPHYQPVSKAPFHGYFFKKGTPGYDGLNSDRSAKVSKDDGRPY